LGGRPDIIAFVFTLIRRNRFAIASIVAGC
jgi:hypothetical protein